MKITHNSLLQSTVILLDRKEMQEFVRSGRVTCTTSDGEEITVSCLELEIVSKREEKTDDPEQDSGSADSGDRLIPA